MTQPNNTHPLQQAATLRLLAAALELQHLTSTAANLVPIPGGDRVIAIGTADQVREVLPGAEQSQWTSVEDDRKPELRKPVLLFLRTLTRGEDDKGRPYETEGAVIEMGEYRHNNGAPYFECFASPMSDNDWVTHWMPLPAGPVQGQPSAKSGEQKQCECYYDLGYSRFGTCPACGGAKGGDAGAGGAA